MAATALLSTRPRAPAAVQPDQLSAALEGALAPGATPELDPTSGDFGSLPIGALAIALALVARGTVCAAGSLPFV